MRGKVHILVYCPIDTLQWGSTHSAMVHGYSCIGKEPPLGQNKLMIQLLTLVAAT